VLRGDRSSPEQAGVRAFVGVYAAVEDARGIARCPLSGFCRGFQHLDVQAPPGQCLRCRGTSQPGADDDGAVGRASRVGRPLYGKARVEAGQRDLALAANAGCQGHVEARRDECRADVRGHAPGGCRRTGCSQPAQCLQAARLPQARIAGRCKAVQIDRVGGQAQPGQPLLGVTQRQAQAHRTLFEVQPLQVGRQRWPGLHQCGGEIRLLCAGMGARQIGRRRWMQFHRHVVQSPAAGRVAPPGVPGGQEVVAQAESEFQHDEVRPAGPTPGQAVALQEDVARLGHRADARVIHIAVQRRAGRLLRVGVELDLRRRDGLRLHAGAQRLASQASRGSRTRARLR
jgi:hypothetical protein